MVTMNPTSAIKEKFVGTWKLVSFEFRRSDGVVTNVMGTDATGMLVYDANGHLSGQMMRSDRPLFASGDQQKGTPDETKAAVGGYIAYFGEYEINEPEKMIIHRTKGALFPNLVGQDQVRYYEFTEEGLTLTTPPVIVGGVSVIGVLLWKKAY